MTDLDDAVKEFLDKSDSALAEYDKGYADADATVQILRDHLSDLREAAEE